jgi:predicted deacetylase
MNWSRFDSFSETLQSMGVPCLIGVIPDCQDPKLHRFPARANFWDAIRGLKASGWTMAQHGYTHVYDRISRDLFGIMRRSEFAGHPMQTQVLRLVSGRKILAAESLASDIFMAPCHAFDGITVGALRQTGFKFITDGFALWPYVENDLVFVPQIFSGPRHAGIGIYTLCCHLDTMSERQSQDLLTFIKSNMHRIIRFEDAAQLVRDNAFAHAARRALELYRYYDFSGIKWRRGVKYL